MDKILDVNNLRISFRTDGGTVKAVRGISFSLYKGRTLAIVGESGSGKSVTSKAILGILANNKIIEEGEIIYDGKDLLEISEEQFTKIRGVKISMIFQDPLSSLNPIMIVGKQLTEAMILKHKADLKSARKIINKVDALLKKEDGARFASLKNDLKDENFDPELHQSLFLDAVSHARRKQKNAIDRVLPELDNILSVDFESPICDFKSVKKSLARVKPLVMACTNEIAIYSDNEIATFPLKIKNYFRAAKDGKEQQKKLDKAMKKYNVDELYDLPAEIRAKSREVILTPKEHSDQIKKTIVDLKNHLAQLRKLDERDNRREMKELMNEYFNAIADSNKKLTKSMAKKRAIELLGEVGINEPEKRYNQYPFELSGGMRQRIVIAIALCSSPEILICDEPTTALDVTIQSQILELINKLKKERNLSIVFITHDLGVVANMADDIAVMYAGKIVEKGTANDIFYDPRHPYTWALLGSVPDLNTKEKLDAIPGTPPNMLLPPKGDAFALRNVNALEIDNLAEAPNFEVSPTHSVASWNMHKKAPDLKAPDLVVARIRKALSAHPEYTPVATNMKNSILNYIKEGDSNE